MVCNEYLENEKCLWLKKHRTRKDIIFIFECQKERIFSQGPVMIVKRERGKRAREQIKRILVKTKQFPFKSQTGN